MLAKLPAIRFLQFQNNLLSGLSILISALNLALLLEAFGANGEAAIFLLCTSICANLQLIALTPFEQFIYHYLRLDHSLISSRYYSLVLLATIMVGGVLGSLFFLMANLAVNVFAGGIAPQNYPLAVEIIRIISITLITGPPLLIIQQKLNGDERVGYGYVLMLIPLVAQCAILLFSVFNILSIYSVAVALAGGSIISVVAGLLFTRHSLNMPIYDDIRLIWPLLKESARIRTAHNLHNFLFLFALNSAVSSLPTNLASIFFTLKRGGDAMLSVINGPLQRTLPVTFGKFIRIKKASEIKNNLKKLDTTLLISYGIISCAATFFAYIATLYFNFKGITLIFFIVSAIALFIYTLLISLEMPYSILCMAYGRSIIFYITNSIFIAIFFSLLNLNIFSSLFLTLPLSMVVSQFWVFWSNRRYAINLVNNGNI